MADPCDIAGETIETCTAEAQRRQNRAASPESQPGYKEWDGTHCIDCMEPIHPERVKMQRCRCVECQGLLELERWK